MARGHQPLRMCVVCRRHAPKEDLTRYVVTPDGGYLADPEQVCPGRGRYVCNDPACLEKFGSAGRRNRK